MVSAWVKLRSGWCRHGSKKKGLSKNFDAGGVGYVHKCGSKKQCYFCSVLFHYIVTVPYIHLILTLVSLYSLSSLLFKSSRRPKNIYRP